MIKYEKDYVVEAGLVLIGRAIRTGRHRMGLTQRDLARLSLVSQTAICRLENGNLSGLRLQRLAGIVATLNGFPVLQEYQLHDPEPAAQALIRMGMRPFPRPLADADGGDQGSGSDSPRNLRAPPRR